MISEQTVVDADSADTMLRQPDKNAVKAIPKLLLVLKDESVIVRGAAIQALRRMQVNDPDVISALEGMQKDPNDHVKKAATVALKSIKAKAEKAEPKK